MKEVLAKHIKGDKIIWIVITFLSIISLVSVYSSIGIYAYSFDHGNTGHAFFGHLKFIIAGFVVLYFVHRVPYKNFFNVSAIFIILAVILLLLTLAFGETVNDATRWLKLPGTEIKFQTSDIAKIALVAYIARILSSCQDNDEELTSAFKKIMVAVVIICGLILPSNFSTAALLFANSIILMFIGRIPTKKIMLSIGALIVVGIFIIILAFTFPQFGRFKTWKARIEMLWKDDNKNKTAKKVDKLENTQSNLAKAAIVTSGMIGKLPGNSSVRYSLPQVYCDFIFVIIIEEWGSLIGILVLLSYLILLYRTGLIVKSSSRTFPAFLAIGLMVNIVFQALAHMAVAVGVLPVTGQPLPIVSMGGTSMLVTFMSLGVILSISRSLSTNDENVDGKEVTPGLNIAK
jgi:cell division protein FtsW